jgi:hypothetical protein
MGERFLSLRKRVDTDSQSPSLRGTMGKSKMGMDAHFVTLCPVTLFKVIKKALVNVMRNRLSGSYTNQ